MDCVCPDLTLLQQAAGFVTFVNAMWVIAVVLGVGCLAILFAHYAERLKDIPDQVWEMLPYAGSLAALGGGVLVDSVAAEFVGLGGVLLFGLGWGFSAAFRGWRRPTPLLLVFSIVSCAAALAYDSYIIGTLGIAFAMVTVAIGLAYVELLKWFGEFLILYATVISFFFLGIYTVAEITAGDLGRFAIFGPGAIYIGAWAGFGTLVYTAQGSWSKTWSPAYLMLQLATVAACVGGMAIGEVFGIVDLAENAGTFFVVWLVSKFVDVPAESVPARAALGLSAAALLWGLAWFARTNADLVGPYLLGFGG